MKKLVVLRLDGDVRKGLRVTAEIGPEGGRAETEIKGHLPPQLDLAIWLEQWQKTYRNLGISTRLKPKEVIYGNSATQQNDSCLRSADQLQKCMTAWLDSKEFRVIDKHLREELDRNEVIQVLIRAEDRHLSQLPWHLWDFIERYSKAEVTFSTSSFKQIKVAAEAKSKVRILAILGDRTGIDVEADRRILDTLPEADVQFLVEPQRRNINDKLWDQPWDILFFAGHSETISSKGQLYINSHDSLGIEDLKYGLEKAISQGLQLAIFNSCDGLGLAQELEQLNIPQMIVMREPVPDRIAQEFLKNFLRAYVIGGESVHLAERRAREQLQGLEHEFPCATWLPIIFQNPAIVPLTWSELLRRNQKPEVKSQPEKEFPYLLAKSDLDNSSSQTHSNISSFENSRFKPKTLAPIPNSEVHDLVPLPSVNGIINDIEGRVVDTIHPGYLGSIKYAGCLWLACHYDPKCQVSISSGESVTVVARSKNTNTLLVEPLVYAFPDELPVQADLLAPSIFDSVSQLCRTHCGSFLEKLRRTGKQYRASQ
jgi:hypothetical protein